MGANRNVGRAKARSQTLRHWKEWAIQWQHNHPDVEIVLIDLMGLKSDQQKPMFDEPLDEQPTRRKRLRLRSFATRYWETPPSLDDPSTLN